VTTVHREPPVVVIYGGSGFFGALLVRDLLANTRARIVIAGRSQPKRPLDPCVAFARSDLNDFSSVEAALAGASVVVHCAGPYQTLPLNPLRAAIAAGAHYVDLAEDRQFIRRVEECGAAARRANVAVMTGMSVVPGLSALLAQTLRADFDRLDAIRTFVAPGTRGSRGPATIRALVSGAGRPLRLLRDGCDATARGWSEPEWIEFPPPVGRRLQYLALETAGCDLLPRYFGARRVEFKAGSEFAWLNRTLAAAARLRERTGFPPLERWSDALRSALRVVGRFGTDRGGVLVEVAGIKNGAPARAQIAVVAEEHGERIPSVPAAIAVAALLGGEVSARGIVPLNAWIAPPRLFEELSRRGLRLWLKPAAHSVWRALNGGEVY
jgi:saccharopine dehydrogenase-like NADP-dependent oxidoreductase